jgi:branched-chain amino acid aminotransferase
MEQMGIMKNTIKTTFSTHSKLPSTDFSNLRFGYEFTDHMFSADYINGKWKNLHILPYQNIGFSPSILALHYGQSIFEGLKAYRNKDNEPVIFRPEENHKRMNASAERMAMPSIPKEVFIDGLMQLLNLEKDWIPSHPGASLYIRPFMFATDECVGIKVSDTYKFLIILSPVGAYYDKPVRVKVAEKYVRAFKGGVGYAKAAGNYAPTLKPVLEANKEGYHQILWLDGCAFKNIHEIGTMNVFFVIDDTVITPTIETGEILKGVTRDSVITILKDNGFPVESRTITINEVAEAYKNGKLNDAFGCGTAATIAHIESFGYQGTDMKLPPVQDRKISNMVKTELENIKSGTVEDKYDWVVKV